MIFQSGRAIGFFIQGLGLRFGSSLGRREYTYSICTVHVQYNTRLQLGVGQEAQCALPLSVHYSTSGTYSRKYIIDDLVYHGTSTVIYTLYHETRWL